MSRAKIAMAAAKMNARIIVVWILGAAAGLRARALIDANPTTAMTSEGPSVARIRMRARFQRGMGGEQRRSDKANTRPERIQAQPGGASSILRGARHFSPF